MAISPQDRPHPIPRWKLIAGAALHLMPFAWLAALIVDAAMGGIGPGMAQALPQMLRLSGLFLATYGAAAGAATLIAALLDHRYPAPSPHAAPADTRQTMADTLAQAHGRFGAEGDAILSALTALPLNHDDPAVQRLVRDLAALIHTAVAAIAVSVDGGETVRAATLPALRCLAHELIDTAEANAAATQEAALILAHYVHAKYGGANLEDGRIHDI